MRIIAEEQVIDRIIRNGKMYLVLRGMEIVKEEEVRVAARRCRKCLKLVFNRREAKLLDRQDDLCLKCFLQILPAGHSYWKSVLNQCLVKGDIRAYYDPIAGTLKPYS